MESQLHRKIVNLIFQFVIVNNELTILWGVDGFPWLPLGAGVEPNPFERMMTLVPVAPVSRTFDYPLLLNPPPLGSPLYGRVQRGGLVTCFRAPSDVTVSVTPAGVEPNPFERFERSSSMTLVLLALPWDGAALFTRMKERRV